MDCFQKQKWRFENPNKMALGMILLGIGYLVLTLAVLKTGDEGNITNESKLTIHCIHFTCSTQSVSYSYHQSDYLW